MDVLEKLNRRFGSWYEGLFGGRDADDLRPRDILRRIVAAMEDARREGLDGGAYVPNVYTLRIAVDDDDQRQYLRTFLDADELAAAVAEKIAQHGYKTRGALLFTIEEIEPDASAERIAIRCRFDASVKAEPAKAPEPAKSPEPAKAEPKAAEPPGKIAEPEPGTVPATVPGAVPAGGALALAMLETIAADGRRGEVSLGVSGIRIGRSAQTGNDLVLGDSMISKRHARIAFERGAFVLYDEGSTNGTRINGAPLIAGEGVILHDAAEISLGQTRLIFHAGPEHATVPAAFARPSAASPRPAPPLDTPPALRLVSDSGENYPLASRMLIGRALTDDIVLIGEGVSAQHARLTVRDGSVQIEDLDTPGGTFVNGERIPPSFPVSVYPGDIIVFGKVSARLSTGRAS